MNYNKFSINNRTICLPADPAPKGLSKPPSRLISSQATLEHKYKNEQKSKHTAFSMHKQIFDGFQKF
jgi:hypothetical protein